jgi:hypothetical protein
MGMFCVSSTFTLLHSVKASSIMSALPAAKGIESSVKTTTPAVPPDSAMMY